MSLGDFRNCISGAEHSVDASVMVGGTLLWDCSDIFADESVIGLKKRILFPSLNSPWLEAYLRELHIPVTEYQSRILRNSRRASQFGFEVRYHGHPITAWYVVVDGKEVFQKQIGVYTTTYPEAVQLGLGEASTQFSLLFETVWKSSHSEDRPLVLNLNDVGPKPKSGHQAARSYRALRVFLSYSSADKPTVRRIYDRLVDLGIIPWFDEVDLLPGQNFDREIERAVKQSDVVIVFLSDTGARKPGYLQRELRYALDVASLQPEGAIFLIPALLEPCAAPRSLEHLTHVKLFEDSGFERLVTALKARITEVKDP